jgi:hypothetical protein
VGKLKKVLFFKQLHQELEQFIEQNQLTFIYKNSLPDALEMELTVIK